jgi:hypothetical protein
VSSAILPDGILNQTIAGVTDILGDELDGITVERAVIGLFYTGVKLSAGTAGTCATPREAIPKPASRRKLGFRRDAEIDARGYSRLRRRPGPMMLPMH